MKGPKPSWASEKEARTDEQCLPAAQPWSHGGYRASCDYSGVVPHVIMTVESVAIEAVMCRELDCLQFCNNSLVTEVFLLHR